MYFSVKNNFRKMRVVANAANNSTCDMLTARRGASSFRHRACTFVAGGCNDQGHVSSIEKMPPNGTRSVRMCPVQ
jgi:hypothetical protein